MARDDIVAGLRNALERGFSLEQAVRSFIDAGYHAADVEEAARVFSGVSGIVAPQPAYQQPPQRNAPQSYQQQPSPQLQQVRRLEDLRQVQQIQESGHKGIGLIIILVIILLLLIGGLIWFTLFGQKFLDSLLSS